MRTIEITTTQKVTIAYNLAPLLDRIVAFILDVLIISIVASVTRAFFLGAFGPEPLAYFEYIVLAPAVSFYTFYWEALAKGQTPGKMALGIRVVKLNGEKPNTSDLLLRWSFRLFDIWASWGAIAAFLVSSTGKSQRLGGILSNTAVIKIKSKNPISLSDILKINTQENYKVKYPEVKLFSESEMLLIKNAIEQHRKFPNKAHREAILMLVRRVSETMGITPPKKNRIDFLKRIIRDYIVLTR